MARKPTHRLKVFDKTNQKRGDLGAGWLNPDKSLSIVMNPGCVMDYNPNFVYTLFLEDDTYKRPEKAPRSAPKAPGSSDDTTEGDIPF